MAGCEWFTIGVMAPSATVALTTLRSCEAAFGWSALALATGSPSGETIHGPVFLKGNQHSGSFFLRQEDGLGKGFLVTGHNPADPAREDTWGPLPLDLLEDSSGADPIS
jgi:hypothetical protein